MNSHGDAAAGESLPDADVVLQSVGDSATFTLDGDRVQTTLKLRGIYNIFNAAAAGTDTCYRRR